MLRLCSLQCGWLVKQTAGVAALAAMACCIGIALYESARLVAGERPGDNAVASAVLYEDDFLKDLRAGRYFKKGRTNRYARRQPEPLGGRSDLGAPPDARPTRAEIGGGTFGVRGVAYRTVCVRLCDGAYFPISTSTFRDRFNADEAACKSRCGSPARLFVYPSANGSPESMVDLEGKPYSDLPNAFVFRTTYDARCQCKPHPWEEAALRKHRYYGSDAWKKQAHKMARREGMKARKQKHAVRAIRRWLGRFQTAISTGDRSDWRRVSVAARQARAAANVIVTISYPPKSVSSIAQESDAAATSYRSGQQTRRRGGQPYRGGWRQRMYASEN